MGPIEDKWFHKTPGDDSDYCDVCALEKKDAEIDRLTRELAEMTRQRDTLEEALRKAGIK